MSSEIAIKVENLSKSYHLYAQPRDRLKQLVLPRLYRMLGRPPKQYFREFWALRNVSLTVRKGETVGIIGVNGSGKSTLLKLICGVLGETSGQIQRQGRVAALLELGTGFNPEFTGRENVYLNAAIFGLSKEEIDAKYDLIADFADIGDFIDQPVKRYSSGMYVRLAFAVVANVDADILIIDEALAVGDALFTQKCMRFLRDFKTKGTILFVSHNSGAVVNLCDRAIWLEKGDVQAIGAAKEVCEQYLAKRYKSKHDNRLSALDGKRAMEKSAFDQKRQGLDQRRDMRMNFLNNSNLRNDLRVLGFDGVKNSFGNGGAEIIEAGLEDMDGKRLAWMVGGETARLVVEARVSIECHNLVVGFNIKDRLGQVIIGQNTYLDTILTPVTAKPGDIVRAEFTLRLPIFPRGTYVVDVAIAEGGGAEVVQLQWVHDAFVLESQASSVTSGLIGLIFDSIELKNKTGATAHDE